MIETMESQIVAEGIKIASAIIAQGYTVKRLEDCDLIAWVITEANSEYWAMLTFIPRPADEWRLLPPAQSNEHQAIYEIINSVINPKN